MAFPGTFTLPAETVQLVYFQAVQSLVRHGFKRFLILNSHGGNQAISRYIVDRINQVALIRFGGHIFQEEYDVHTDD